MLETVLKSRQSAMALDRQDPAGSDQDKPVYTLVFEGRDLLLNEQGCMYWLCGSAGVPPALADRPLKQEFRLGCDEEAVYQFIEVTGVPQHTRRLDIRSALGGAASSDIEPLSMAASLLNWGRKTQFCPSCGQHLVPEKSARLKRCDRCQSRFYPQVSPCVIVLVTRGDEVLLARSPRHKPGMFTLLAGFIESGESVEQALAREVYEESGLRVDNLCYKASQPWPFSHNLMLGYHAEYASGELLLDPSELEDGGWFNIHSLPELPPSSTLSCQLIEHYLDLREVSR